MSRALLDVNVLLALLDPMHIDHERAQDWFADARFDGWATCPITQNGYLRIATQPGYTNPVSVADAIDLLDHFTSQSAHEFWPASGSLLDRAFCDVLKIPSHRHMTDTYLLALARHHGGRLATLDRRLNINAVAEGSQHLTIIG
ncbi:TA system VapC family ribonuclease toxin [Sphingomonas sp. SUN039]|uniref:TA system VapC family ribonuclease toxin n=1 Tax=Sphingomonas sp. SUN039 TaxID=2937787 RepID=UPI00216410D7|nr:TA system VapC family ribonuclease toxin [Sphingomonas sp. SUN039]UVO54434.1 PIN domain-containing protein [Sphingomonas sp. SUN039]